MHEVRVTNWNELQDALFADAWDPAIGRYRSRCAYRGLSAIDYRLETTLIRMGGDFAKLEGHLLRNFRKYAHRSMVERDSLWHWLALAKHHGLPARLMDWTYSPFVALHFATANIERFDTDAVVWVANYVEAHRLLPGALRDRLEREGANVFTVEMISEVVPTLEEFGALSPENIVLFFEPPSIDDRIVNQFAFFSVASDPTAVLDEWLGSHPDLSRRIIIPAELKWEIRDKLDQANITERVLFPGLDGLSRWLERHYSPKTRSSGAERA
ncbi:MAG: FRG domain-containing protein [Verrucomicrobia bacterium]|nr:MAG: FRG domain-containing protein [Verrucomicrobiota bacterium]